LLNERALALCLKLFGQEHPATAASLSSRADLLHDQGDLAGAQSLYECVLEIREKEKVGGPTHMATALSLSNLASVLTDGGELAKARTYCERALAIFEMVSPEHPWANRIRSHLAHLLLSLGGAAAETLTFSETALAGHEKILGRNHQWTRDSAETAADALANLGRADEALALRERFGLITNDGKRRWLGLP
jgi:tetratricopeptide (TPR) repeat protein